MKCNLAAKMPSGRLMMVEKAFKLCASVIGAMMATALYSCSSDESCLIDDPCQFVDMRIGTGGHGHVFMGASVPYGMVQLGPTSIPQSWDWCSGYHDSDSTVIGFSHTHLSGTGIGDLFDITVMPVVGEVTYARGNADDQNSGLWSYADRTQQKAEPGYYRVPLTRYGIDAEMTATNRVGLHRYTFPESEESAIVFDLQNGGCWDSPVETHIEAIDSQRVAGWRYSRGWANDQKVYFVADFSRPMADFAVNDENQRYARISFPTRDNEQVLVKVAISPVSVEGAIKNMEAELPGWDFDAVRTQAYDQWRNELSRVRIAASDNDIKKKFYTGMYHLMIAPATFADVDGQYRGADGKVYVAEGFVPYTVFSLWDTYRAALPLMSIIDTDRYSDFINSMVDIAQKQGRLPVWHLWGCETDCMVGNPGVIAVGDAITKHVQGLDYDKALEAMLATVADKHRGLDARAEYGYIPADKQSESVAKDLEYAIADAALAAAARSMGMEAIADSFALRSKSYTNYFDPATGFLRGKMADGSWHEPFDPFSSSHRADDYCEGNAWQYTWLVPHDVDGLMECFGGKESMVQKLDSLFILDLQMSDDASPDITGLIGQYAHGNEPGHHILYIYSMLGQRDKATDLIRQVLDEMYTTNADGLSGNEDAGQMSAWYIMSALGFYQVEPGSARYWFGSPIVDKAEIAVPGGTFSIKVHGNGADNKYIDRIELNGQLYELPYLRHEDIMAGGMLDIYMTGTMKPDAYDSGAVAEQQN